MAALRADALAGLRLALALLLALGVVLLLFGLMNFMIQSGDARLEHGERLRSVDFVRVPRTPELETRQRSKPERPPPPERPPEAPQMQVAAAPMPSASATPFALPQLSLPTQTSGGPFIGGLTTGAAGVADGELIPLVRLSPQYPGNAARDRISGEVRLEVTVNPDGTVKRARVLEARPRGYFEAAALSAARRGRFRPRIVAGEAVESVGTYTMQFQLDG